MASSLAALPSDFLATVASTSTLPPLNVSQPNVAKASQFAATTTSCKYLLAGSSVSKGFGSRDLVPHITLSPHTES